MATIHPLKSPDLGCEAAAELLPWLVNGSLDGGERRRLEAHLRGCAACRGELAETVEAARIFSQHVPSLALAEYAEGLEPGEPGRTRIEAHLAICPSCREELELARLATDDAVPDSVAPDSVPPDNVIAFPAARPLRTAAGSQHSRRQLALAASFALAAVTALLWSVASTLGPEETAMSARLGEKSLFTDGFESGDVFTWTWSESPARGLEDFEEHR